MKGAVTFFALLLSWSTIGLAQEGISVHCPEDECHVAPYFTGTGGFVAHLDDDYDEATLLVVCGTTITERNVTGDENGLIAQSLDVNNGLACGEEGRIEIRGIEDGAWYWITGDRSSAVAYFIPKDVLDVATVEPVDPGSPDIRLTTAENGGVTFIQQESTGRMGILPTFLPEPELIACGPWWSSSRQSYYQIEEDCVTGDGETWILLSREDAFAGERTRIEDGKVRRPVSGTVDVSMELYGNHSGTIVFDSDMPPELGWYLNRSKKSYYVNPFIVEVENVRPGVDADDALEAAGVTIEDASISDTDSDGLAWINILPSSTYCTATESYVARLRIKANPSSSNEIVPFIDEDDDGIAAETTLDVLCPLPPTPNSEGQELVLDGDTAKDR